MNISSIDQKLKQILELTAKWNAVFLLDEADVSLTDICIFLR
jgi:hypothetical protein